MPSGSGLAVNSDISRRQIFDRKIISIPICRRDIKSHRTAPPICKGGHITIKTKDGAEKNIPLNRIHIEEDAGKLMHLENEPASVIRL